MAALPELEQFDADVFQIETDTVWLGGVDGPANNQGKALANRTKWLKAQVLALLASLDDHEAAVDPHPQYATDASVTAQLNALLDGTPGALDTLNELAEALGDNPNFAASVTTALGLRLTIADFQKCSPIIAFAAVSVNAATAAFTPPITVLTDGMEVSVHYGGTNTSTTPTLKADGTAVTGIVKGNNLALALGDIQPGWNQFKYDATFDKWVLQNPATGAIAAGLPTGYKFGLVLANNGTTQIDIGTGKARSAADNYDLVLAATMTKTLQAVGAWAAGTNQNGLFSGAKANSTWYHCFLIRKDADGSIDAGFDTSITAANKPAGYSNYRRIGSILTDASGNIRSFLQVGNKFIWTTPINDVSVNSGPADNTPTLYVISTPPGIRGQASIVGGVIAGNAYCSISSPDSSAPTITNYTNAGPWLIGFTASTPDCAFSYAEVNTNLSSQIRVTTFSDGNGITRTGVSTLGWTELN